MYTLNDQIAWCIKQHRDTNHYYDKYLPYEFHLRMVVQVFYDFKHLLPSLFTDSDEVHRGIWEDTDMTHRVVEIACWGHDLIEDCRVSYNDCVDKLKVGNYLRTEAAEIIFAVSNNRVRNRKERADNNYYALIRATPGAIFVKLCDRIANVQYSKMTKSKMFKMYGEENEDFMKRVDADKYPEMKNYLINLFKHEVQPVS